MEIESYGQEEKTDPTTIACCRNVVDNGNGSFQSNNAKRKNTFNKKALVINDWRDKVLKLLNEWN